MADVAPFRGIRYNLERVTLDDVTSPPYDVVSPADRIYFHNRHPKNVVRLILGEELPEDSPKSNRFSRAAAYLDDWLRDGTLKQDPEPALYVYEQQYTWKDRPRTVRGFVSLVKLHRYEDGVILPHENTLARPKSDLARLIRATNANLDSIYALYPDPKHTVDQVLARVAGTDHAGEATDRKGVRHRLWVVRDRSDIEAARRSLEALPIVIADGHHRYETALAYRDEVRARLGNPSGDRPCDYTLMTLVNVYAPDVIVFPTHRMVRNLDPKAVEGLDASLRDLFDLVPSSRETLMADLEPYGGKAVGVYKRGRAYVAVPRQDCTSMIAGPAAVRNLDLCILHELILERSLGIDSERLRQEFNVAYTRDEDEALSAVDCGEFQLAFFLNQIKLEAILDVARAGERMPQKATYFYPKLLSGLVMRRIEP